MLRFPRYLARNAVNKDTIREGGGIELLVGMLAGPEETAGRAAAALWSLSDNCPTNKDAVRTCGGVPALVKLLSLGPEIDTTVKAAGAIGRCVCELGAASVACALPLQTRAPVSQRSHLVLI